MRVWVRRPMPSGAGAGYAALIMDGSTIRWWGRLPLAWLAGRRPVALDVVVAVLFAAAALLSAELSLQGQHTPIDAADRLILAGCWLPLAWRRFEPFSAFAVSAICLLAGIATAVPVTNVVAAHTVLYLLAASHRRPAAIGAAAVLLSALAAVETVRGWHPFAVSVAGAAVIAVACGEAVRARHRHATLLLERAARAEREAQAAARQAVVEERLHIARELHDLVAHSTSVIAVQAGSGRLAAGADPAAAVAALSSIEQASREVLAELRRLLGVLRRDNGSDTERQPVPALAEVSDLIAGTRAAGVATALTVSGTPRPLPPALELSAYRIVQEALTNVVRHAPGSAARVSISYCPSEIAVEVRNAASPEPTSPRQDGGGHGLIGMRERIALFAGELQTGPTTDGGFRVLARFPCPAAVRSARESE